MKYVLGLDLGITSIGWAVLGIDDNGDTTHIIDTNVTILEKMEDDKGNLKNAGRREARGARRLIRRRAHRVKRVKQLLKNDLKIDMDDFYNIPNKIQINPYTLKVKGLNSKLSKEELSIILVHYAKHRGYRSNRKNDKTNEDSALLGQINNNEKILQERDITYSEYIYEYYLKNDGLNFPKLKNTDKEYQYLFNRATVQVEIERVLDKQIELNVISESFKEKYIDIWGSQRDFSEGPSKPSPYAVDFQSVFGYCKFEIDGKRYLRAPKCAPTTEFFTLLQKLNNLRFSLNGEKGLKLTPEQIEKVFKQAKTKKEITYKDIDKALGIDASYEGISISRDNYVKLLKDYKNKNNISIEGNVDTNNEEYKKYFDNECKKQKVGSLKNYNSLLKEFKTLGYENLFHELSIEYLDDIITCLTFYKTDNRIKEYFSGEGDCASELDWSIYPKVVNEVVPNLPNYTDSASLSLVLMRKLNFMLEKGIEYDKAMNELGLDHSKPIIEYKKSDLLPSINIIQRAFPNELTNPRVVRVLSYTIKTVNEIIKKYGKPHDINIEVARDIANTLDKRREIENEMLNNYETNERQKTRLLIDFPNVFKHFKDIKKTDLEKIKLYDEQNGMCMYSLKPIAYDILFSTDLQVDHIIPYSLSFNDSFNNKTLVYSKTNQEKGNQIPKDYFRNNENVTWGQFVNLVNSNYKLSDSKKKAYLANEIPNAMESRSLNDTRFITKYITKIFANFLDFNGKVNCYNGKTVNILKKSYGISRLSHSLENENYKSEDLWMYKNYNLDLKANSLEFKFTNKQTSAEQLIILKKHKESEKTPSFLLEENKKFDLLFDNSEKLSEFLENADGLTSYELVEKVVSSSLNESLKQALTTILNKIHIEHSKKEMKKNRNNHFHHALDAAVTACMTPSLLQRIVKFHKKLEYLFVEVREALESGRCYKIEDKGEVICSYDDLESYKQKLYRYEFELPYPNFVNEVKYRIYEVNEEIQKQKFKAEFNDGLFRNIRPIFPTYFANKRENGKLHKETIYGITSDGEKLTKRISVLDLTQKKADKILYKDDRAKATYEAVINWLKITKSRGEKYPKLSNGREIKKVTIEDGDATKALKVKNGYAAVDIVVRIDVYKSKVDGCNRLYFAQRHAFNIAQERRGIDFDITLWWGQAKMQKQVKFSEINNYELVNKVYPGDLIYLKTKNGEGYCYVKGFSSGLLEVGSIFGDSYDLCSKYNSLFKNFTENQYRITISTITSMKKIKIDMLGELDNHA